MLSISAGNGRTAATFVEPQVVLGEPGKFLVSVGPLAGTAGTYRWIIVCYSPFVPLSIDHRPFRECLLREQFTPYTYRASIAHIAMWSHFTLHM